MWVCAVLAVELVVREDGASEFTPVCPTLGEWLDMDDFLEVSPTSILDVGPCSSEISVNFALIDRMAVTGDSLVVSTPRVGWIHLASRGANDEPLPRPVTF